MRDARREDRLPPCPRPRGHPPPSSARPPAPEVSWRLHEGTTALPAAQAGPTSYHAATGAAEAPQGGGCLDYREVARPATSNPAYRPRNVSCTAITKSGLATQDPGPVSVLSCLFASSDTFTLSWQEPRLDLLCSTGSKGSPSVFLEPKPSLPSLGSGGLGDGVGSFLGLDITGTVKLFTSPPL